jgi:hypothetical protein
MYWMYSHMDSHMGTHTHSDTQTHTHSFIYTLFNVYAVYVFRNTSAYMCACICNIVEIVMQQNFGSPLL